VAALTHEAVDDAVEDHTVVVVLRGERHEVVHGLGSIDRIERDHQRAHAGVHRRRVALAGIDAHLVWGIELLLAGRGTIEGGKGGSHGSTRYPGVPMRDVRPPAAHLSSPGWG